ncbi:uncharacterized protein LOC121421197 [Lytechinus variegatus]|uniref:uncharacterized protein LOC121421197 n=1 Tax=Lytechinus variegatus TaxID=7654 RepID=UPI001BB14E5B|nr:uncharacterized protein LOC121421197 [Lytechinus variegatus]
MESRNNEQRTPESEVRRALNKKAAKEYQVPYGTLRDKVAGRTPAEVLRYGPRPFLTTNEETEIVNWAVKMGRVGFGQKMEDIQNVVKRMMEKEKRTNPFVANRPGRRWWTSFRARNPKLVFRKAQSVGKERTAVTKNRIDRWFEDLEKYLEEHNARSILEEPSRIFNADESGFPLGGRLNDRVLALKGEKVVQQFKNSEKGQVTVLVTVCAEGSFLPPMIVLPGRHNGAAYKGAPRSAFFARTKNGWMDSKAFYGFIANLFQPFLAQKKVPLPALLLVDGLSAHQTLEVAKLCEGNGILLYRFPPNATHILQPCDVSVFRSLKSSWNRAEQLFRFRHPGDYVTKTTFATVFADAWREILQKPSIAASGFRAAGIFPFTKRYNSALLRTAELYHFVDTPQEGITPVNDAFIPESDDMRSSQPDEPEDDIPSSSSAHLGHGGDMVMDPYRIHDLPPCHERPLNEAFIAPSLDECLVYPEIEVSNQRRRKEQLPEAISGEEFIRFVTERENKREEEERKRQRKEEREQKRVEKEKQKEVQKEQRERRKQELEKKKMDREIRVREKLKQMNEMRSKKDRQEKEKEAEKTSENGKTKNKKIGGKSKEKSIRVDDDTEDDVYVCPECLTSNDIQWIGCDFCMVWVHHKCSTLSECPIEEIHKYQFRCNFC